jgi:TPR repeat protein
MYSNCCGVPKDYKTVVECYKLAAEQGNASACHNLGVMYAFVSGVLRDYVYAHMWGNIAISN